jgi:hypothetical protein
LIFQLMATFVPFSELSAQVRLSLIKTLRQKLGYVLAEDEGK